MYKSLYVGTLDTARAFDNAQHSAVVAVTRSLGAMKEVEHRHPLSPVNFKVVMDQLLQIVPKEYYNANLNNQITEAMAFADVLALLAELLLGLQPLISYTSAVLSEYFGQCKRLPSMREPYSLSTTGRCKRSGEKTPRVTSRCSLRSRNGVYQPPTRLLSPYRRRQTKASLERQQRLFSLIATVLSVLYYYHVADGWTTVNELTRVDWKVTTIIKQ